MIISLGCRSLSTSCNLPGDIRRAALKHLPIWSCSGWGLPCLSCHHESGELLPRRFTLTRRTGRFVFCGTFHRSPGVRVTNHPALRSSDFPLRSLVDRSDHAPTPKNSLFFQRRLLIVDEPLTGRTIEDLVSLEQHVVSLGWE